MDFTDPYHPRELGWFDRGAFVNPEGEPDLAGAWSTYFYRGRIFSNEIQRGLDVFNFYSPLSLRAQRADHLNAQVQEPLGRR